MLGQARRRKLGARGEAVEGVQICAWVSIGEAPVVVARRRILSDYRNYSLSTSSATQVLPCGKNAYLPRRLNSCGSALPRTALWARGAVRRCVAIYKICRAAEWREAEQAGASAARPSICATASSISRPPPRWPRPRQAFRGAGRPPAGRGRCGALGPALKWEPSRGGALFPHLYGALPLTPCRG